MDLEGTGKEGIGRNRRRENNIDYVRNEYILIKEKINLQCIHTHTHIQKYINTTKAGLLRVFPVMTSLGLSKFYMTLGI